MIIDRRFVLKSMATMGITVTTAQWAHACNGNSALSAGGTKREQPVLQVTPIVTGGAYAADFLAGVRAATASRGAWMQEAIRMQGLNSNDFVRLSAQMKSRVSATLVGLVDDASAVLILDLVRSAGGHVLANDHHRVAEDPSAPGKVRTLGYQLVTQPGAAMTALVTNSPAVTYAAICCTI